MGVSAGRRFLRSCLLPSVCCLFAAPAQQLGPLVRQIRAEVRLEHAMDYMRHVWSTDRWFTFPKFEETAEYVAREMKAAGLKDVEIVGAPADGVSQLGYWTMPLAWDVKNATLEILEPRVAEEFRVLADYRKIPSSLCMWSGPTPPGGLVAEVVEIKDPSPAAIAKLNLAGKLALTGVNPGGIKWALAKAGALGAVNAFTENTELRDGRQWVNSWGDAGWGFLKGQAPLVCFSIAPRQSEHLRKLLAAGPVRVKAVVESRYYAGTYPYVTGVIRGTGPGEEVLTLGHTSEQGAHDNATGVAAMLESLAALNRLITAGKLPRPARSIRILAMGELYGSMHYIAQHPERIRRTVAAMCVDTPAGFYHMAGTEYTFYLSPQVAKSYVDAFVLRVAEAYFSEIRPQRPFRWRAYMTGTDSYLGEPTIGIPTVWPYSGSGIHTHHNSEDTPESVDPRSLRDLTVLNAAFLYYLASAGESEAHWLAEVALTRGYEQVVAAATPFLDRIAAIGDKDALARLLRDGIEKIDYTADRESQAVLSVDRLVAPERRPALRGVLDPLAARLRAFSREQSERLKEATARRAGANIEPAPPADPQMAGAAKIVVKRKRFGTIPLDDLPVEKREGYPSGAWATTPITALYWCDGRRSLAEVIRLTRLELGPVDFDFVGYFRFLAKHGYVELTGRRGRLLRLGGDR